MGSYESMLVPSTTTWSASKTLSLREVLARWRLACSSSLPKTAAAVTAPTVAHLFQRPSAAVHASAPSLASAGSLARLSVPRRRTRALRDHRMPVSQIIGQNMHTDIAQKLVEHFCTIVDLPLL